MQCVTAIFLRMRLFCVHSIEKTMLLFYDDCLIAENHWIHNDMSHVNTWSAASFAVSHGSRLLLVTNYMGILIIDLFNDTSKGHFRKLTLKIECGFYNFLLSNSNKTLKIVFSITWLRSNLFFKGHHIIFISLSVANNFSLFASYDNN